MDIALGANDRVHLVGRNLPFGGVNTRFWVTLEKDGNVSSIASSSTAVQSVSCFSWIAAISASRHRSIYSLWRQVLESFDTSLIGLTATPSKRTFGFFQQNLVQQYSHEKAVADGVNVGCDIYRINTAITAAGSKVKAGLFVDKRSLPPRPGGAAHRGKVADARRLARTRTGHPQPFDAIGFWCPPRRTRALSHPARMSARQKCGRGVPPLGPEEQSQDGSATLSATFETGEALHARILTERRQNWLARRSLAEGGQGRGQYIEPAALDTAKLPLLPEGWTWRH